MQTKAYKIKRRKAIGRNVFLGAAIVIAAPVVYNYLVDFVRSDPFVGLYKKSANQPDESIGIRMDAVELRDFKGAKLVSSAFADRVDVRKDRQVATLYGVKNGLYNGEKEPIRYSAANAVWNFQLKQVSVNQNVTVKNKDFDLKATGLTFDDKTSLMRIHGDISGKLYQGDFVASTLVYNMQTGAADAGPVEWQGELALSAQDEDKGKPRKWDIKSSHWKSLGSDANIFLYENATASDGDLIIVAPKVQQNKKTDVLTAEGGIEYYSGKSDIKADKCVIYRKEKRVVMSGHVFMYVKPKAQENDPPKIEKFPEFKPVTPDKVVAPQSATQLTQEERKANEEELRSSKNLRDFPLVVVSDQIEYWYGKGSRHAVVTGNPQGRQAMTAGKWRHIWAHHAFYDGEKETLKLFSSENKKEALMKNSVNDEMQAIDILVSTKEGDDSIEGTEAEGHIYSSDDDIPKDDKKKGTPPPTTGTGKGGGG